MFEFLYNIDLTNEVLELRTLDTGVAMTQKGVALVEDGTTGNLIIAVGTAVPTFMSVEPIGTAGKGRVAPIRSGDRFKVVGASGTYVPGAKYTLHASNGTAITNTTLSGVAKVERVISGTTVEVSF